MTENEQKDIQSKVKEIETYYQTSLTDIVVRLSKNPIVRHFKGTIYRVVGVGKDCITGLPQVIYTPLDGSVGVYWTRELANFLSPIDQSREDNVTGQKRRFDFIDNMVTQLDLVKDEELIKELNKRTDDLTIVKKDNIIYSDYVIARVVDGVESGTKQLYDVQNYFDTKEQAEENLERNRRHRKLLSLDYKVLHRIFYI